MDCKKTVERRMKMKTISKMIFSMLVVFALFYPDSESHAATDKEGLQYLDINEVDPKPYYSWGDNPTITVLDNGLVLSVSEYKGDLTYTLGEFYEGEIYWTFPEAYDTGREPEILTLDDGELLEVHISHRSFDIYYNLGRFNEETNDIDWYSVGNFLVGTAKVGFDKLGLAQTFDGEIALTHKEFSPFIVAPYVMRVLEYTGDGDDRKIKDVFDETIDLGTQLSITDYRNASTSGTSGVLEVHQSDSLFNNHLYYRFGNIKPANGIGMNAPHRFDDHGKDPVALQLDNEIYLTMFEGTRGDNNPTWYRTGELSGAEIKWTSTTYSQFNGTNNDVVQLQNGLLLNVHKDPDGPSLRYVLGTWDYEAQRVWWWTNGL
ncbi:hypothetical protein [Jeotgalibacillus marinus]|uniref:Uncharacterized protein n=1 Tax=Jeotgalibacillus marinus TaxID=86667 RepID=A0ABV3Q7I8_9BACL